MYSSVRTEKKLVSQKLVCKHNKKKKLENFSNVKLCITKSKHVAYNEKNSIQTPMKWKLIIITSSLTSLLTSIFAGLATNAYVVSAYIHTYIHI